MTKPAHSTEQSILDLNELVKSVGHSLQGETNEKIAELRKETMQQFTAVRTEMQNEFAAVRTEMQNEFAAVRTEMNTRFEKMEVRFDKMEAKMDLMMKILLEIHAEIKHHERRIAHLEVAA